MQKWLVRRLIEAGKIDADGISRTLRLKPCPDCGVRVLTGLDADVAGLVIRLDTSPLSPRGEALNTLVKTETFVIFGGGKPFATRTPPKMWRRSIVLAEHVCGREWPDDCYADEPVLPTDSDEPPY